MIDPHRPLGFRYGLLFSWLVGVSVFKWSVIGFERLNDFLLGLAVEACFWGWVALAATYAGNRLGRRAAGLTFFPIFYFSAGLVFSYTYFFDSAVERRFSLLDTDLDGMLFFFRDVLPARGFWILFGLLTFMHAGALAVRKRGREPGARTLLALLAPATLLTLVVAWRADRVATPLYDIVHDYRELWLTPKVQLDAETRPYLPPEALDKSDRGPKELHTRFKKVLVLVMETMTAKRFEEERAALSPNTFFVAHAKDSVQYERYFPNNQDSRTGMLDLVGSRLIPYEAYRDAEVAAYQEIKSLPSLLDRFQSFGYATAFAVSQTYHEPVITELPWSELIHLRKTDIDAAKPKRLCFNPYEFEDGCEDLVLLPKIFDFIEKHERAFLFQEFIWGHAHEYNEASGRTNTDYYSAYVDHVIAELKKRGLYEETLIAITSDHGFRDKGLQDRADVYRIPLWFHAPGLEERHETALLSHLDFKDLLFNVLEPGSTPIDHNPAVLIQGPTATSMMAALSADHELMLFKTRGNTRLLLSHKNVGAALDRNDAPRDAQAPHRLIKSFDEYRRHFDSRIRAVATGAP